MKGSSILHPNTPVVEDFRLVREEWVLGTRRRIYINSQHYIRTENYTPQEVNDWFVEVAKAYRDGDIKQPNKGRQKIMAVPNHIIDQIWIEQGVNPLQDEETHKDLILNNPDLKAFRCVNDKKL